MVVFPCGANRNPLPAHQRAIASRLKSRADSFNTRSGRWRSSSRTLQPRRAALEAVISAPAGGPFSTLWTVSEMRLRSIMMAREYQRKKPAANSTGRGSRSRVEFCPAATRRCNAAAGAAASLLRCLSFHHDGIRPAVDRHLELHGIGGGRELLHGEAALVRLASHSVFVRPGPRVSRDRTTRGD